MSKLRILLLSAGLVCAGLLVVTKLAGQTGTPAARATTPPVMARVNTLAGQEIGEVLINNQVVMRLHAFGNYTPGQRADTVAARWQSLWQPGFTANDVTVGTQANDVVLLLGNQLLLTVEPVDALANHSTTRELATEWQAALRAALGGATPATRSAVPTKPANGPTVAGVADPPDQRDRRGEWPAWTEASTKVVPILSAGTPGLQLGFAQVTGPRGRVDRVRSVFELDAEFQRIARVKIFIPSESLTSLGRVQGVAVTGLLQYQVIRF